MRTILKGITIAALALAVASFGGVAYATTISFGSSGGVAGANDSGTFLDGGLSSAAIDISATPNAGWDVTGSGLWVSDTLQTGDPGSAGFVVHTGSGVPSPPGAAGGAVPFFHTFTLPAAEGILVSASLTVFADDTTDVFLNGTQIAFADLTGPFPSCSVDVTAIGCIPGQGLTFGTAALSPFLVLNGGTNTLEFRVYQAEKPAGSGTGDTSFGLKFDASVDTTTNDVPEPGTMLLMGIGLVALGAMRRRRASRS